MKDSVSVKKAIQRGYQVIAYPIMAMALVLSGLFLPFGRKEPLPTWFVIVGFLVCVAVTWLYWSIASVKWQIWAFTNVRNVHELKRKALEGNFIFSEDNFLNRIRFVSASGKEKIKLLEDKFEQEDLFIDQANIPAETIIYQSKIRKISMLLVFLLFIIFGLLCLGNVFLHQFHTATLVFGVAFLLFGGFFGWGKYRDLMNDEPQIILSDKGIQTATTKFKKWSVIEDEKVRRMGTGNHIQFYFVYRFPSGDEKIQINHLTVEPAELEHLLYIYRGRHKAQQLVTEASSPNNPEALFDKFFGKE